jgi:hypothetical protein
LQWDVLVGGRQDILYRKQCGIDQAYGVLPCDALPGRFPIYIGKAGGEPVGGGYKGLTAPAGIHDGSLEMPFKQDPVNGILNSDHFGRSHRVKFKRILPMGRNGNNNEIRVGYYNPFFFFKITELTDVEKAADTFDIVPGRVKAPLI